MDAGVKRWKLGYSDRMNPARLRQALPSNPITQATPPAMRRYTAMVVLWSMMASFGCNSPGGVDLHITFETANERVVPIVFVAKGTWKYDGGTLFVRESDGRFELPVEVRNKLWGFKGVSGPDGTLIPFCRDAKVSELCFPGESVLDGRHVFVLRRKRIDEGEE